MDCKLVGFLAIVCAAAAVPTPRDAESEDGKLLVPQLIAKYGYPVETHYVTTPDGYILCLHRIPHGKNHVEGQALGEPFFVQHGLLSSSADFLITGPNKALAYNLADAGYDVWMGNFRGNRYSRNHTTLHPDKDESKFWDFSWHEMGIYDLPTMVDYVLETTGYEQLLHVGHSQGTTTFYVLNSQKPEYNKKFKAHVSLAPIAFMKDCSSPLMVMISQFSGTLDALLSLIGINEFLPTEGLLNKFAKYICDGDLLRPVCTNSLFIICGFNGKQMNSTILPILLGHTPAGSSTRQFLHYAQNIKGIQLTPKFRLYDYGAIKNKIIYDSFSPPSYELEKITAPVHLLYSSNDWLSNPSDVHRLVAKLGNVKESQLIADKNFNHLDYLYAIDAKKLVNDKVIEIGQKYKKNM